MPESRRLGALPASFLRAGRTVLDCSGPIHSRWLERAVETGVNILVHRREPTPGDAAPEISSRANVRLVSGDLEARLEATKRGLALIIDDVGALHFHDAPLDLLRRYYAALAWDGQAWIRFPKTLWVLLADGHRIALADYLALRFPRLVSKILATEFDPIFAATVSTTEDWIRLRKDHDTPDLAFGLRTRAEGGTSCAGEAHSRILEYYEMGEAIRGGRPRSFG